MQYLKILFYYQRYYQQTLTPSNSRGVGNCTKAAKILHKSCTDFYCAGNTPPVLHSHAPYTARNNGLFVFTHCSICTKRNTPKRQKRRSCTAQPPFDPILNHSLVQWLESNESVFESSYGLYSFRTIDHILFTSYNILCKTNHNVFARCVSFPSSLCRFCCIFSAFFRVLRCSLIHLSYNKIV